MISRSEFIKRYVKDQEHAKRLRLYNTGHLDEEIALACNVNVEEIKKWRKKNKLSINIVRAQRVHKVPSPLTRELYRDYKC